MNTPGKSANQWAEQGGLIPLLSLSKLPGKVAKEALRSLRGLTEPLLTSGACYIQLADGSIFDSPEGRFALSYTHKLNYRAKQSYAASPCVVKGAARVVNVSVYFGGSAKLSRVTNSQ